MKTLFLLLFTFLVCAATPAQPKISQIRFRLCEFESNLWVTDSTKTFEVYLFDTRTKTKVDSLKYGSKQYYKSYQYFWFAQLPADSRIMALIMIRKTTNDTMTFYFKSKEGMNFIDLIRFIPGYWKSGYRYELTSYDSGRIIYQLMFDHSEKNYWEKDTLHKCDCQEGLDWRKDYGGTKRAYVEGTDSLFTGTCWTGNVLSNEYTHGMPNGNSIEYYPSGNIKLKATNDGNRSAYYDSGKIKAIYKNGIGIEYYENGQIASPIIIKQNKRCIKRISYFENGKRKSKSKNRKKGLHNKIHWWHNKSWDENGKKISNVITRSRSWGGEIRWTRTITITLRKEGKIKFKVEVKKSGRNIWP